MGLFMVDYFSLALTHGLLALAAWRLVMRADLDRDPEPQTGEYPAGEAPKAKSGAARRA